MLCTHASLTYHQPYVIQATRNIIKQISLSLSHEIRCMFKEFNIQVHIFHAISVYVSLFAKYYASTECLSIETMPWPIAGPTIKNLIGRNVWMQTLH